VELVGYEDEEAGNFNCEVRSLRLQSWEVHMTIVTSNGINILVTIFILLNKLK